MSSRAPPCGSPSSHGTQSRRTLGVYRWASSRAGPRKHSMSLGRLALRTSFGSACAMNQPVAAAATKYFSLGSISGVPALLKTAQRRDCSTPSASPSSLIRIGPSSPSGAAPPIAREAGSKSSCSSTQVGVGQRLHMPNRPESSRESFGPPTGATTREKQGSLRRRSTAFRRNLGPLQCGNLGPVLNAPDQGILPTAFRLILTELRCSTLCSGPLLGAV